ncbi:MAG: peptidoglycan DD-metalloendopeptidase family protein [Acidobacteriota bacterium]
MSLKPRSFLISLVALGILTSSCTSPFNRKQPNQPALPLTSRNSFDEYLKLDFPPADAFDFAVGDQDGKGSYQDKAVGKRYSGWYIATHFADQYSYGMHTGEDWSGLGPPASDLGQDVHAVANGKVAFAEFCGRLWGNVVMIEHLFYENNEKKTIRSVYAHLNEIKVRPGEEVQRRQVIATVGQDPDKLFAPHLHLELRWDTSLSPTYWPSANGKDVAWVKEHYASPSAFINSHRRVLTPQREASLVLVDQAGYKMRLYKNNRMTGEFDVSFGQANGAKQVEGDNKTPTGMYFVIQKHRGQFDGPYGAYYGGHWIKVNYPNAFDALRGKSQNLISPEEQETISSRWRQRAPTLETTRLGGGIGFHGWIREWPNEGPRHLSWGCVVMHIYDISKVYDQIPEGAMVVIF